MRLLCLLTVLSLPLLSQPVRAQAHLDTALSYVGIVEFQNNRGPNIDKWLKGVGLLPGNPYCAAFGSYCLETAHVATPTIRSGLATRFITSKSIPADRVLRGQVRIQPGAIAIFRYGNGIHGHFAFVLKWKGVAGFTVEANTRHGPYRSAEEGVWIRRRSIYPGNYFRIVDFTPVTYSQP